MQWELSSVSYFGHGESERLLAMGYDTFAFSGFEGFVLFGPNGASIVSRDERRSST